MSKFGNTVNQCFEAYVLASMVNWYKKNHWTVTFVNPPGHSIRLKFSTRGAPDHYTYARCAKGKKVIQVRHSLRVATNSFDSSTCLHPANLVLDVAVVTDVDLSFYTTNAYVNNCAIITFAESKHM